MSRRYDGAAKAARAEDWGDIGMGAGISIRAGIVGASGYGAAELLRLLQTHPSMRITYLSSGSGAGQTPGAIFPQFRGIELPTMEAFNPERAAEAADVLFLAGKNGTAMKITPALLDSGRKIVDFSADFRLKSTDTFSAVYKMPHESPHLLEEAAYGLVELNRPAIRRARLVANPGCYATAAILSLAPLLTGAVGGGPIADPATFIIDAYSGVSGAGRSSLGLDYHFPEANENLTAYKVIGHRHTSEIEQAIAGPLGRPAAVTFTPHLAPINRGILATTYATLTVDIDSDALRAHYESFYRADPFVVILPDGEHPRTGAVRGANYVQISVSVDPRLRRATILNAEDNLVKGAAGQALQNMNLICGLPEETGLIGTGVYP
ncbi:MAG TPA: N-acetyl-gamma-glutamyl-phosphate reductase [Armatimonadota bacterium]|nr:N-acetyl-gamma-glutamyl-phosphate reductase [Armatimonadota bacterium]